jgi:Putative bacterial sensory transduction regulator
MIQRFERQLLENWLRASELRFLIDRDGDFVLDFYSEHGPDYRVQLSAEGPEADVLSIRIHPDVVYSEALRDRIDAFVAGWNRKTRWPKAFVVNDSRGRGIRVIGENSFPLGPGIHQALLDTFIVTTIDSGQQLIAELDATASAAVSPELEAWLHSTE